MDHYIFFSKSNWHEAPRLRHQVAGLLRSFGGNIHFFQKPSFVWWPGAREEISRIDGDLLIGRTRQLIHHQLRVFSFLRWLNALVEKRSIRAVLGEGISKNSVVVNFNYDYYFLREIFPDNRIVTIINDDFVAQSRFFSGRHAKKSLGKTCASSDVILTVSYPLMRQASEWCSPELFFPWADVEYREPALSSNRNAVLLWAHIDERVDFELVRQAVVMRPSVIFYLVGPQSISARNEIEKFASAENVVVVPSAKLDDLPLDRFFAAIIPYKKNVADIEAVTMSNKSLQLMARGLPIVAHGMPNFYDHRAIVKANDAGDFLAGLDYFRENFSDLQASIGNLVSDNQPQNRFSFFRSLISRIDREGKNV